MVAYNFSFWSVFLQFNLPVISWLTIFVVLCVEFTLSCAVSVHCRLFWPLQWPSGYCLQLWQGGVLDGVKPGNYWLVHSSASGTPLFCLPSCLAHPAPNSHLILPTVKSVPHFTLAGSLRIIDCLFLSSLTIVLNCVHATSAWFLYFSVCLVPPPDPVHLSWCSKLQTSQLQLP